MTSVSRTALLGTIAVAATLGYAAAAVAQSLPKNWNYEIKDGKRVPKANRVTNADGSWREETKQGTCTTTKESSAKGEVKITRKCD
jgi:hypothetical protein